MSIVDLPDNQPWRPSGRGAARAAEAEDEVALQADAPRYIGQRGEVLVLAFTRMAITILTLGIGRFWMATRLRRHYWSSIVIGGAPLEYTGRAGEKLIGFLIAVVILAAYLMVVNLALIFIGLSVFQGNQLALQLPLLALIPFIPWARYRARRYLLARTRWRGIRFGMAPGAWGYTGRYLLWWGLTILTLGLLYPVKQLQLSRFATGRTYFGDLRFEQTGTVGPLMRSWLWVWAPVPVFMVTIGLIAINSGLENPSEDETVLALVGLAGTLGYLWVFFAGVRHQVFSFRYLNSKKILGGATRFIFKLGTWRVIKTYIKGWIMIYLGITLATIVAAITVYPIAASNGIDMDTVEGVLEGNLPKDKLALTGLLLIAVYLPVVAASTAFSHAFITHPLLAAVAETTRIDNLAAVSRAQQRAHDEQAEAGGFADALGADIGAAF